jgi:hypothetical protein
VAVHADVGVANGPTSPFEQAAASHIPAEDSARRGTSHFPRPPSRTGGHGEPAPCATLRQPGLAVEEGGW